MMRAYTAGQTLVYPPIGALTLVRRAVAGGSMGPVVVGWDYVSADGGKGWMPEVLLPLASARESRP